MQSNCDLELRLHHPPCYDSSRSEIPQPKQEPQICVSSDLIHLQAKAILSLASRDVEERSDGSDPSIISSNMNRVHHQKTCTKRSLRSFIQKRNVRIQASCPYRRFPISLFIWFQFRSCKTFELAYLFLLDRIVFLFTESTQTTPKTSSNYRTQKRYRTKPTLRKKKKKTLTIWKKC